MALRVLTWPLGYVLIAKGKQALFVGADLAWTVVNVGLDLAVRAHFGSRVLASHFSPRMCST